MLIDWHNYVNLKCEVNFYIIDLDNQYVLVS